MLNLNAILILILCLLVFISGVLAYVAFYRKAKDAEKPAPASEASSGFREMLADDIVKFSIVGLIFVSVVVLGVGIFGASNSDAVENSQYVFAALLPLFATWVGTVLAYYFSKQNFEAASKATESLVKLSGQKLRAVPIEEAMIPIDKIVGTVEAPNGDLKEVPIQKVAEAFEDKLPGGRPISRVVILTPGKACVGVLHRGLWSEMRAIDLPSNVAVNFKNDPKNKDKLEKVHDLASESRAPETFGAFITGYVAFARAGGTLADAKMHMENKDGCQDVIVTATGKSTEPVVGWVTNVEIGKALEA